MKSSNFNFMVGQGIKGVWLNKTMSFASFCILMVSLLLVGMASLLMLNIDIIVGNIEDKHEIVVFLDMDATEEDAARVELMLKSSDNISEVIFVDKEEAIEAMRDSLDTYEVLFDGMEEDFLPYSFRIRVGDVNLMSQTANSITNMDSVEYVRAPHDFARVLNGVRTTVALIGMAVFVALVIVCLVIVSNTTRASVFSRRREINIMKFVGATNAFIRIPFFIEGMFVGLLSALAAWGITWFGYESFVQIFTEDASMWMTLGVTGLIPFETVRWVLLGSYAVVGMILGAMGTVISVRKHLKV